MECNSRRIAALVATLTIGYSAQALAAADTVTGSATYVNNAGQVVHCVSTESGRTYCGNANTRYAIRGTPSTTCVEGRTWGFDNRGVWVTGGCSADFASVAGDPVTSTSTYVNSAGRTVHCVSTASGRSYCGNAHVHYVIASNPNPVCVEGKTWGMGERGIWVSGGCNADFDAAADAATAVPSSVSVDSSGRIVKCVSTESGRTYCGTAHRHYVISGMPDPVCIEGNTWGHDAKGVWVTGGCKASFTYDDDTP
jgi:hypothetical protein